MDVRSSSNSLPPPASPISALPPSLEIYPPPSDTPTSKPLPSLPTELKKNILRFCTPATLAKTSGLSLAFLQLSSPPLYDEIDIVGFKIMKKLFCSRVSYIIDCSSLQLGSRLAQGGRGSV